METARFRKTRVVLAAAHLDSDPTNNRLRNSASVLSTLPHAARSAAPFGAALDHLPPALGSRRSLPRSVPSLDPPRRHRDGHRKGRVASGEESTSWSPRVPHRPYLVTQLTTTFALGSPSHCAPVISTMRSVVLSPTQYALIMISSVSQDAFTWPTSALTRGPCALPVP